MFLQTVSEWPVVAMQNVLCMVDGAKQTARLVVVDDHPASRDGLQTLLRTAPGLEVVGEAATGRDAIDLCGRLQPDLVLLDLHLPDLDGISVARTIVEVCPTTRVVMLTMDASPARQAEALQNGVHAYVIKGASRRELLAVVRRTLSE